jgi:hypothetical protein
MRVICNNDDCLWCVDGECSEEESIELVCESPNYFDYGDMQTHRAKGGVLYCENYVEKT